MLRANTMFSWSLRKGIIQLDHETCPGNLTFHFNTDGGKKTDIVFYGSRGASIDALEEVNYLLSE
jgi:hypothetical protein